MFFSAKSMIFMVLLFTRQVPVEGRRNGCPFLKIVQGEFAYLKIALPVIFQCKDIVSLRFLSRLVERVRLLMSAFPMMNRSLV